MNYVVEEVWIYELTEMRTLIFLKYSNSIRKIQNSYLSFDILVYQTFVEVVHFRKIDI